VVDKRDSSHVESMKIVTGVEPFKRVTQSLLLQLTASPWTT